MLIIRLRICVATNTAYFCIVIWVGVTLNTLAPFPIMRTAINWKILTVMIKNSRIPSRL